MNNADHNAFGIVTVRRDQSVPAAKHRTIASDGSGSASVKFPIANSLVAARRESYLMIFLVRANENWYLR
jgi:hypothetical protein